jgi:DNA-binding transcriptional ArsR family regulator
MSNRDREAAVNKALSNELRVRALAEFERVEASPSELAKAFEIGLSKMSYHVKVLKDCGAIRATRTEPRRGAVEHYYRATGTMLTPGTYNLALERIAAALEDGHNKKTCGAIAAILEDVGFTADPKGAKSK